jgi:hypothetical protein
MASLLSKINAHLGRIVDSRNEVIVENRGQGQFILEWNLPEPKPTLEELEQYNDVADFNDAILRLRAKRNSLLAETDWTANSDVTMSAEMTTYRQALRDITNGLTTVEQVNGVVFPTKPN